MARIQVPPSISKKVKGDEAAIWERFLDLGHQVSEVAGSAKVALSLQYGSASVYQLGVSAEVLRKKAASGLPLWIPSALKDLFRSGAPGPAFHGSLGASEFCLACLLISATKNMSASSEVFFWAVRTQNKS